MSLLLAKARYAACQKWPFASQAILSMVPVSRPGMGTLAVDQHWRIYYDEAALAKMSVEVAAGVILHEVDHLLKRHHKRAAGFVTDTPQGWRAWNLATDAAINEALRAEGVRLPDGVVYPESIGQPEGLSAEDYYRALTSKQESEGDDGRELDTEESAGQEGDCSADSGERPEGMESEGDDGKQESGADDTADGGGVDDGGAGQDGDEGGGAEDGSGCDDGEGAEGDSGASGDADGAGQPAGSGDQTGENGCPSDGDGDSEHAGHGSEGGGSEGGKDSGDGEGTGGGSGCDAEGDGGDSGVAGGEAGGGDGDGNVPVVQAEPVATGTSGSCSDGRQRPWELGEPDEDNPGLDDADSEQVVRSVAESVRSRGTGSGSMRRWAEEILNPEIDPAALLRHLVKQAVYLTTGVGERSYRRPSRRDYGPVVMPCNQAPVPKIAIIVDTSGSMDDGQLGLALGLIGRVVESYRITDGIQIVTGDEEGKTVAFTTDPSEVDLRGGGGTDMGAIVESVVDGDDPPHIILVATDGDTPWPDSDVGVPVVCCLTSRPCGYYSCPEWIEVVKMYES